MKATKATLGTNKKLLFYKDTSESALFVKAQEMEVAALKVFEERVRIAELSHEVDKDILPISEPAKTLAYELIKLVCFHVAEQGLPHLITPTVNGYGGLSVMISHKQPLSVIEIESDGNGLAVNAYHKSVGCKKTIRNISASKVAKIFPYILIGGIRPRQAEGVRQ